MPMIDTEVNNKLITINIPLSLYKELEQRHDINRSEVCRDALKNKLEGKVSKISPSDKFYFTFALCISASLIVVSMAEKTISMFFLLVMSLVISIASIKYFVKDLGGFHDRR